MRDALCDALLARGRTTEMVFLTGDLGFMALEPLRDLLGDRFINCGVAEQNMVGVAAGLARGGFEVWVYSIASFCVTRPFEQIRNDVAFHRLPVRFIGSGGGYGYGVMGPSHHALEDYGLLLTLPGMAVQIPITDSDVAAAVERIGQWSGGPSYLRLGRTEAAPSLPVPAYRPWRCLSLGCGPVVVACGSMVLPIVAACAEQSGAPQIWALSELCGDRLELPPALLDALASGAALIVVEEHGAQGGLGAMLARELLLRGVAPRRFRHLHACYHPGGRYGSQAYHRRESGIDPAAVAAVVAEEVTGDCN